MGSILNESDRAAITERLRALPALATRQWGSMDVTGMLQHLRLSAQMALGELSLPSANKRAFQMFPLKHLALYVIPFPKGAPTAAGLKPNASSALAEERAALMELIERIGIGPREGDGPEHPLFGPLNRREWGVVTYKHTDHHLKQFGA
jgi:hypothetical protein